MPTKVPSEKGFPIRPAVDLIPTRHSLLSRLKNWEDHEAWRQFFDTYWVLIHGAAINAGLTHAEAQDVVQETMIAVAKHMPGFHYSLKHGSFKSWLLRQTSWRIADQFRKRQTGPSHDTTPCSSASQTVPQIGIDPATWEFEVMWDVEYENCVRNAAFEKVKLKVDPKSFQAFDLYIVQEWPAIKVAKLLRMSRAHVYLCTFRVRRLVEKEMMSLRQKSL